MRLFSLILILYSLLASIHPAIADEHPKYTGPSCIGEFCFDVSSISMLITESEFVNKYGKGQKESDKYIAYCYDVPDQKLYVRFRPYIEAKKYIIDVFVSDVTSCPSVYRSKIPFKPFVTKEGLKIGDPYKKAIYLYGKPNVEKKATGIEKMGMEYQKRSTLAPFGDTVLIYGPEKRHPLHAHIYLRKGKVSAILISMSP